jgi:hypothetical protein
MSHLLFLRWRDPLPGQFTIGPVTRACLFAHGLPANAVLARFTDAAFKGSHHFSADHAFFLFFAHGRLFCSRELAPPPGLIQQFDLCRILED